MTPEIGIERSTKNEKQKAQKMKKKRPIKQEVDFRPKIRPILTHFTRFGAIFHPESKKKIVAIQPASKRVRLADLWDAKAGKTAGWLDSPWGGVHFG